MRAEYNQGNFEINESYREVRTYLGINKNIKTILITSSEMDEGKTTISCNNKVEECIQKVGYLDVITSGARPSNTSILLNSQSMKDTIKKFRQEYDYVFIDSPPVSRMNDACIITQYVDGTILVNAVGAIDARVAKITLEKLNKVGSNILGVVLNKFKPEKNEYYSYYSYYGYEENKKRKLFGSKRHKKHKK